MILCNTAPALMIIIQAVSGKINLVIDNRMIRMFLKAGVDLFSHYFTLYIGDFWGIKKPMTGDKPSLGYQIPIRVGRVGMEFSS
jgi:hypothetical protein